MSTPESPPHPDVPATADEAIVAVSDVAGWMSEAQIRRLWSASARLRPGDRIVEIGSFQGRSTVVLAAAAPAGSQVVAIDPHGGTDRGPEEYEGYEREGNQDFVTFHANLAAAGVSDRVRHVRQFSDAAHDEVDGGIDLLFIDGAHRFPPARADIREWGSRVTNGGTMLIHDSFSAVGVTLALLRELFLSGRFRYVGRSGSLTEYRREPMNPKERALNAARQIAELPYFAYNVLLKVMIQAGFKRYTRYVGHPSGEWPY